MCTVVSKSKDIQMRTLLFVILIPSFLMKSSLSSPASDWDDAIVMDPEPIFRKDYTLGVQKQGWYKLHRVPENWFGARERCTLEGAELATPLNPRIRRGMLSQMLHVNSVFTGIHSAFNYGDFFSIKGVPLYDMPVNWSSTLSPDKNNRCVEFLANGTISIVNCDYVTLPYICYKQNDYSPLTNCGTTDTEYTYNSELGTCYKLHTKNKIWGDAFKTCSAEGGNLVVINSDAELKAVVQLFSKDSASEKDMEYSVLVGILIWEANRQWATVQDQTLEEAGYSTWSPNDQKSGRRDCGSLKRSGLVAVPCTQTLPFVCEKKPDSLITSAQLYKIMEPIG